MRKILILVSSVSVEIQLNLEERSLNSFGRAIAWDQVTVINV